ncbi:MAG TPA: hypothetical protein PK083_02895 [Soehngenia sp.]|nr:hypothetical protein [Soehngenia sp.]HPP31391.1 hypothetical protein [Soehngenia sp.]
MIDNDERIKLLEEIIDNLLNWDGKLDSAIRLIEINDQLLEKVKTIKTNEQINNSLYEEKLKETVKQLDKFLETLKKARIEMIEENKQLNLKDKVLKNYIPQIDETIFIDKDVL